MKRLVLLYALLLSCGGLCPLAAQSLDIFRQQLAQPDESSEVRVVVTEYGDAADAVARASKANTRLHLRGYRVCIFFDNGQDARAGAVEAKELFEEHYPGVRVYMVYENPYFKVTAGDCLTTEEAIILKGRISEHFPKAFLKSEELSITDLLR